MICCKIIANYNDPKGSFSSLYNSLMEQGKVLWINQTFYFGTIDKKIDKKAIVKILKKNGFKDCYVQEYNNDNLPHENEFIDGWVESRLIENNYEGYLDYNKEKLMKADKALDIINKALDQQIAQLKQKDSKREDK